MARLRAATLLPSRRIVSGLGPMKMMPFSAQASANSGLSDNRPYPGWIASAPDSFATRITSSIDR
jgi:hypothetical protein